MGEATFQVQIKQFNRKALRSGDTQIRLVLDCVDIPEKQNKIMEALSDIQLGNELVEVTLRQTE